MQNIVSEISVKNCFDWSNVMKNMIKI